MFNEPKNGDFASLVENLSTEKLQAIREENEALFRRTQEIESHRSPASGAGHQRTPISGSENTIKELTRKFRERIREERNQKEYAAGGYSMPVDPEAKIRARIRRQGRIQQFFKALPTLLVLGYLIVLLWYSEDMEAELLYWQSAILAWVDEFLVELLY